MSLNLQTGLGEQFEPGLASGADIRPGTFEAHIFVRMLQREGDQLHAILRVDESGAESGAVRVAALFGVGILQPGTQASGALR